MSSEQSHCREDMFLELFAKSNIIHVVFVLFQTVFVKCIAIFKYTRSNLYYSDYKCVLWLLIFTCDT